MKPNKMIQFASCCFLLSISLPLLSAGAVFVQYPNKNDATYSAAEAEALRDKAYRVLTKAYAARPIPIYLSLMERLQDIRIALPPEGLDFAFCQEHNTPTNRGGVVKSAAAYYFEDEFYICRAALSPDHSPILYSTLIHETAHAIGYSSECEATAKPFAIVN